MTPLIFIATYVSSSGKTNFYDDKNIFFFTNSCWFYFLITMKGLEDLDQAHYYLFFGAF